MTWKDCEAGLNVAALKERRKGSGTGVGGEKGGKRSQQRPVIQGFTVQGKGWNFILIVKVEGDILEQKYKCKASLHYREETVQDQGCKYKEQSWGPCNGRREMRSSLRRWRQKWRWTDPNRLKICSGLRVNRSVEGWHVEKEAKKSHWDEAGNFHLSNWIDGFAYWVATGEINFCFKARQIRFKHKIFSLHVWATPLSPPMCIVHLDYVLTGPTQQQKHLCNHKDYFFFFWFQPCDSENTIPFSWWPSTHLVHADILG